MPRQSKVYYAKKHEYKLKAQKKRKKLGFQTQNYLNKINAPIVKPPILPRLKHWTDHMQTIYIKPLSNKVDFGF